MATECTLPDNTAPNYSYPNNTLTTTLCQTLAKGERLCSHTIPYSCWRFCRFSALFLPSETHRRTARQPVLAREAASVCPSRTAPFRGSARQTIPQRAQPTVSARPLRSVIGPPAGPWGNGVAHFCLTTESSWAQEKGKPRPDERITRQARGADYDELKPRSPAATHTELARTGMLALGCSTVVYPPWASYP